MKWRPLLSGRLAEEARSAFRAIVFDLREFEASLDHNPSLAGGAAGLALLHGYRAKIDESPEAADAARRCLNRAIAVFADSPADPSLFGGLAGVGWAAAHLQNQGLEGDYDSELSEIDEALLEHVARSEWPADYDLVSGLVGFGVYACERLPRPDAVATLEHIAIHLKTTATEQRQGISWWTNPTWLPSPQREQYPRGYYNLGLAHGVPGIIALLARMGRAGIARENVCRLAAKAVGWMVTNATSDGFPSWVVPGEPARAARLAWCYGDPGVAAAIWTVGRLGRQPEWESQALALISRAAQRPQEKAGVVDAGLCHGSAGLAHIFNRFFQATGDQRYADAAFHWFEETIAMSRTGTGVGGYSAWSQTPSGEMGWVAEPGFLTGAAGIALALGAAISPTEPAWDRVLMLDLPPRESEVDV